MSKKFKFNIASIVACAAMLIFFQGCSSLNPWGESDSDKEALMNRRNPLENPMNANTLQTKPTESTTVRRDFSEQNQAYQRYLANKPETLAEFDKKKRYPKLNVNELNMAMDNSAVTSTKIEVTSTSNLKEVIDHNKKNKASSENHKSSTHHKKKKLVAAKAKKEVCIVEAPTTTSAKSATTTPASSNTPQTISKNSAIKSANNTKASVNPTQGNTSATSVNSQVNSNKTVDNSKQQNNSSNNANSGVTSPIIAQPTVSSNSSQNGSVSNSKDTSMNKANTAQPVVVKNDFVQKGNVSSNQAGSGASKTVTAAPTSNVGLNPVQRESISNAKDTSMSKANGTQPGVGRSDTAQTGNAVNVQSSASITAKQSIVPVSSTSPSSAKPETNQDLDKMSQSDIEKYLKDKFKESPEAGFIDKLDDDSDNSAPQTGGNNATTPPAVHLTPITDNTNNVNTTSGVSRILRSGGSKKLDKINSLLIECYYNIKNKVTSTLSNSD